MSIMLLIPDSKRPVAPNLCYSGIIDSEKATIVNLG